MMFQLEGCAYVKVQAVTLAAVTNINTQWSDRSLNHEAYTDTAVNLAWCPAALPGTAEVTENCTLNLLAQWETQLQVPQEHAVTTEDIILVTADGILATQSVLGNSRQSAGSMAIAATQCQNLIAANLPVTGILNGKLMILEVTAHESCPLMAQNNLLVTSWIEVVITGISGMLEQDGAG